MEIKGNITTQDNALRDTLENARVIAVVGHSDDPTRTSYQIAQFLRRAGYKVYAVNPTVETIDGEKSFKSVADIPEHVDVVNVFRGSRHVPAVVEDAINAGADTVWTQLGVINDEANERAVEAGLNIVVNRCIKIEHLRLNIGQKV